MPSSLRSRLRHHLKASDAVDLAALPTMDELPGLCAGGGQTREPSGGSGEHSSQDWSSDSGRTAAAPEPAAGTPPAGFSAEEVDARIREAARGVRPLAGSGLELVRTLQDAPRNQGRVDLMRVVSTGSFVAVKRMPNSWVRTGPEDFTTSSEAGWFWGSSGSLELPWVDIGLSAYLSEQGFPYACKQLGVFRDYEFTYVTSAYCPGGDLFGMMDRDPSPGEARESMIRPIMLQVCSAVRWLHSRGVAHRDISLENILLGGENENEVKLIDFGMATLSRTCKQSCGKRSYTAPEMLKGPHDPFTSDAFAVGVVLYSLASRAYPWNSTRPGKCQLFDFICQHGLRRYLQKRRVWRGNGNQTLSRVFSEPLVCLVEGLLSMEPASRTTISGPRPLSGEGRPSVWDAPIADLAYQQFRFEVPPPLSRCPAVAAPSSAGLASGLCAGLRARVAVWPRAALWPFSRAAGRARAALPTGGGPGGGRPTWGALAVASVHLPWA
ncbi:unnamed protein product [Prorocentrum cordatum]|uniref:Protein kinase domain-containing protein n=1 Tax=Prorocentrum cordatum TaxID=2364126 RepID=A0ABN9UDJ1_9DINO|nr:unnamed protein product [Polarella glacialis]